MQAFFNFCRMVLSPHAVKQRCKFVCFCFYFFLLLVDLQFCRSLLLSYFDCFFDSWVFVKLCTALHLWKYVDGILIDIGPATDENAVGVSSRSFQDRFFVCQKCTSTCTEKWGWLLTYVGSTSSYPFCLQRTGFHQQ